MSNTGTFSSIEPCHGSLDATRESNAIPLDDIVENTDTSGTGLKTIFTSGDGIPVKPSTKQEVRHIKQKATRQALYSVLRNILCWMVIVCVIVLAVGGRHISSWLHDERVIVIVLLILGLIGIPFQALHAAREVKNKQPSLVAWMLRHARDVTEFKQLVRDRNASPPKLAAEITLKSGAIAHSKTDPDHWMLTSRRRIKEIPWKTWMDLNPLLSELEWDSLPMFWIILSKDYRYMNKGTSALIQDEVAQFKRDCEFDKYLYFMSFQYVLDVEEGDYFPDAEACLVYRDQKPRLYEWTTYLIFLCLALDMMYHAVLFLRTTRVKEYKFVKSIGR